MTSGGAIKSPPFGFADGAAYCEENRDCITPNEIRDECDRIDGNGALMIYAVARGREILSLRIDRDQWFWKN
jgi:hypothetical protein